MPERFFQLETAAADVLEVFAQEANIGCIVDAGSGLIDFLTVDQDLAGEYQGLGAFAGGGQAAFEQQFVEPNFQIPRSILPEQFRTRLGASCRMQF